MELKLESVVCNTRDNRYVEIRIGGHAVWRSAVHDRWSGTNKQIEEWAIGAFFNSIRSLIQDYEDGSLTNPRDY